MFRQFAHAKVTAISSAYGKNVQDLTKRGLGDMEDAKYQRLLKTIGFTKLRHIDRDKCVSDMFVACVQQLLQAANCQASEIDAFITSTQTPDTIRPSLGFTLQERLGLSEDVLIDDCTHGCSGFVFGILKACTLVESGQFKKVVVCMGDTANTLDFIEDKGLENEQKANDLLFGDGAGAVLIEYSPEKLESYFNYKSHGKLHHAIESQALSVKYERERILNKDLPPASLRMHIDGMVMAEYVLADVKESIEALLAHCNLSLDDVSYCLAHQGNRTLNKSLAMRLGTSMQKAPFLAGEIGNTGSASIPLMLGTSMDSLSDVKNKPTLVSGFGIGLCVYNALLDLRKTIICPVVEV